MVVVDGLLKRHEKVIAIRTQQQQSHYSIKSPINSSSIATILTKEKKKKVQFRNPDNFI